MTTNKKIIMLGDSIIEWNFESSFINYGHSGFKTLDVLFYLQERDDIKGDLGILLVGINDILSNMKEEYIQDNYKKIVDIMKNNFSEILLISILPTDSKDLNSKVEKFNIKIKEAYKDYFLDMHHLFINDIGLLENSYTVDGLHLSRIGYEIFNRELDKAIENLYKMRKN